MEGPILKFLNIKIGLYYPVLELAGKERETAAATQIFRGV
jgi:hypothetical protein